MKGEPANLALPSHIKSEYRPISCGKDLVVSFSHARTATLKRNFPTANLLHLVDSRHNYFLDRAGYASMRIADWVEQQGFTRVCFTGASKGGFGALLWGLLAAKHAPSVTFKVLAFSPQTRLWPENEALYFPSYASLLKRVKKDDRLRKTIERYGDLTALPPPKNFLATIVYGDQNRTDRGEAERLTHPRHKKYPVPFPFHASRMPMSVDLSDKKAVEEAVAKIYRTAINDPDAIATLPPDQSQMVHALMRETWIQPLDQMMDNIMSEPVHPAPRKAHGSWPSRIFMRFRTGLRQIRLGAD